MARTAFEVDGPFVEGGAAFSMVSESVEWSVDSCCLVVLGVALSSEYG